MSSTQQWPFCLGLDVLTHWGQVTYLCVSKLTSIASDNGLWPGRRQAIIWNYAGILLIGPSGTNFSEILSEIQTFSLKEIRLKMLSAKCQPFCLGLIVLRLSTPTVWGLMPWWATRRHTAYRGCPGHSYSHIKLNSLRTRQNSNHFADDIFKCIYLYENFSIWFQSCWNLIPRVQLIISQHWFR